MNSTFTIPEAGIEPVPGYCLSQRLGRGGYGEVWRAYAPGGFQVALKFVPLADACGVVELRALDVIRDIRHPNLLVTFASWQVNEWLIIAMELADKTLMDRFREAKNQGMQGIPREELLDYFQEAARGIDFLNEPRQLSAGSQRFAVQHRDIKPQNILLVGNGVKVADFGLARLMNQAENGHSGGMTPAYAAPEFFKGQTANTSDQYCLAVTYCKMRGGNLPFDGTLPEVMSGHLSQVPNLRMIPNAERGVVARALSKEPKDRWPSCRTFVEALLACDNVPHVEDLEPASTIPYPATIMSSQVFASPAVTPPSAPSNKTAPVSSAISDQAGPASPRHEHSTAPPATHQPASAPSKPTLNAWIIGRDADCDLVVNQSAVSGQHCRLSETAYGYYLEDLGSSNGTFVNGNRIASSVPVVPSDNITLGRKVKMPWPSESEANSSGKVIYVGRDPDNDIILDYATVSGRHARITVKSGKAHIEDLSSTNGIAIGNPGNKVRAAPLHPNDVVYFGSLPVPAGHLFKGVAESTNKPQSVPFRGKPIVLGRDADCDKILDLPMISGRHARLWQDGKRIMIEDLGSTNGTFVNGERIPRPTAILAGDLIGLGSLLLALEVLNREGEAPAEP
jgi:pSer/pThr/pTyr-binding forkhead associated (FHA) protein